MSNYDAEQGRRIVETRKHAPPRGNLLGRIESWGLDVYENSPHPCIDALIREQQERPC